MQGKRLALQELSATSNLSLEKVHHNVSVKSGMSHACPMKVPHDYHDDQKQSMWKSARKWLFLNKILISYDA